MAEPAYSEPKSPELLKRASSHNPDAVLRYQPQGPTLREFHNVEAFMRAIIGPLGSGKTQACICEVFSRCHEMKPNAQGIRRSRWAVVRNTYVDLMSTTIKDWREVIDPLGLGKYVGGNQPHYILNYRRTDGTEVKAEIEFLAFDREDDVRKIRGLQLTGAWLNELKELNKAVVDMLLARIGRFPARASVDGYWFGAVGDSNAPAADHWLGVMALAELRGAGVDEWKVLVQPGAVQKIDGTWRLNQQAENLRNLDPRYYARQMANKKEDWIRANLANEFIVVIDGRPVHPDFSQTIHVAGGALDPTPGRPLTVGIDFGRTPAACIMQEQYDGRWLVLDEVCTQNMGARRFGAVLAKFLNEKYPNFDINAWGDPAGSDMAQTDDETPFMMLEESDIYAFPAPSNDLELRFDALDKLLTKLIEGMPAILIAAHCRSLITGLAGGYQFRRLKVSGDERFEDKPLKNAVSHICEACHYGLYGAGEGESQFNATGWGSEAAEVERDTDFDGWHPSYTGLQGP